MRRQCNRFALVNCAASTQHTAMHRLIACVQLAAFFVVLWLSADRGAHRWFHAGSEPSLKGPLHRSFGGQIHCHSHSSQLPRMGEASTKAHSCANSGKHDHSRSESRPQPEGGECPGCVVELMIQGQGVIWFWDLAVGHPLKPVIRLDSVPRTGVTPRPSADLFPYSCGPPNSRLWASC